MSVAVPLGRAARRLGPRPRARPRRLSTLADALVVDNFASGGLTVLAGGAALALARAAGQLLWGLALRRCVVRAEFDSRDDSYRWIIAWLTQNASFRASTHFTVTTTLQRLGSSSTAADPDDEPAGPPVLLVPLGTHALWRNGGLLWFRRERQDDKASLASTKEREALTLYSLGPSRAPVDTLIAEARALYAAQAHARTSVYHNDEYGTWRLCARRPPRPLASVVLADPAAAAALLADARDFLAAEAWYARRGIPYRRGYLLHGPPGTGKTSYVTALAGELRLPIYMVLLSSPRLTDEMLTDLLSATAPRAVLLLEDVDAVFARGRGAGDTRAAMAEGGAQLSFAGLLNAIDGVAAQEGRLLFLTTNHPERLSEALVRPGRVDKKVYFGRCTAYQGRQFVAQFFDGVDPDPFVGAVPEGALSVAELQGLLMEHRHDAAAALEWVRAATGHRADPPSDR